MHIIDDIKQVKSYARRGQKKTVIAELKRRGVRFEIAHDGWPIIFISEVSTLPSDEKPNWEGMA